MYRYQLVDVGWVTGGEAAEDYQELPAGVSRHVPSHKDRMHSIKQESISLGWQDPPERVHGQAEAVIQGRLPHTHGVHRLLQRSTMLLWVSCRRPEDRINHKQHLYNDGK